VKYHLAIVERFLRSGSSRCPELDGIRAQCSGDFTCLCSVFQFEHILTLRSHKINSWESALGNKGWNWANLFPYYLKHENLTVPSAWQLTDGASYISTDHGFNGPVKVGWRDTIVNGTTFNTFNTSHQAVGIPYNKDVNGGAMHGFYFLPKFVDRDANIREDAARAYYYPFAGRKNLNVFFNTTTNKIVWNSTAGTPVAGGVQVTAADGTVSIIHANKEVIMSAGSLRSPVILELSGIGNPR
jgi:choline dehydrogenase-like flavoprotein